MEPEMERATPEKQMKESTLRSSKLTFLNLWNEYVSSSKTEGTHESLNMS